MKVDLFLICTFLIVGIFGYYYAIYKEKKEFIRQVEVYKNGFQCGIYSIKELYSMVDSIQTLKISNMTVNKEGILEITRNGYKHDLFVENGYVKLLYPKDDSPFIGRGIMAAIHQIKLNKTIKAIIDGNELMDELLMRSSSMSSDVLLHTKNYKNIYKWQILMVTSLISVLSGVLLFMCRIELSLNNNYIEYVQMKEVSTTTRTTIGEIVDFYLPDSNWKFFVSDTGECIVEVAGVHQNVNSDGVTEMLIQFQYVGISRKADINQYTKVSLSYMEINGISCSKEQALKYLDELFEIYSMYGS